jgi:hypothetical protein
VLSLLCLAALVRQDPAPAEVRLNPTDDVWVYQCAEDQASDPLLRAWGSEEGALGSTFEGHLPFSYSCLKFQLPPVDSNSKLASATLLLTHAPEPGWDPVQAEKNPLQARALTSEWEEENWTYETAAKVHPGKDKTAVYGAGFSKPAGEEPFTISIPLTEGESRFLADFDKAQAQSSRYLGIALTTTLRPEGENSTYKVYSRNNEAKLRPVLVLTFAPKS